MGDIIEVVERRGSRRRRPRVLCYGPPGIGKTSFGAAADDAYMVGIDGGDEEFDVRRALLRQADGYLRPPRSYAEFTVVIDAVLAGSVAPFGYLVVDTITILNEWIVAHVCARDHGTRIPDSSGSKVRYYDVLRDGVPHVGGYPYGSGDRVVMEEWRALCAKLDRMRDLAFEPGVILLAQAAIVKRKDADVDDFEAWAPDMSKGAGSLLHQWCDVVIFAHQERRVFKPSEKQDRTKVEYGDTHIAHLATREGHTGKNRYALPDRMEFRWSEFDRALRSNTPERAAKVRAQILELLPGDLAEADVRAVHAELAKIAHNDTLRLLVVRNKVRAAQTEAAERAAKAPGSAA